MTADIHAESMLLYAEDAAETDTPWMRWEFHDGFQGCKWTPMPNRHPLWNKDKLYRRRPPPPRITWHNVYPDNITAVYESRKQADDYCYLDGRIGVLRIELSADGKTHISTTMEEV